MFSGGKHARILQYAIVGVISTNMRVLKVNYVTGSNFGDCVFPYMLNKMGIPFQRVDHNEEYKVISTCSILGVGTKRNTMVGGSGIISASTNVEPDGIFFLVRGKHSANKIRKDVPLGDPAIALSKFYKPSNKNKKYEVGLIPHQIHFDRIVEEVKELKKDYHIIDPSTRYGKNFENYIDQVNLCERIISTSLHGLITAHAYGIPAIAYHYDNRLMGDNIKFQDYYSVWPEFEDSNVDEVLEYCTVADLDSVERFWSPSPNQINMRSDTIMDSCPFLAELGCNYYSEN